jgi:hypothetical protein
VSGVTQQMEAPLLDSGTIPTGEFEIHGAIVTVARSKFGTVIAKQISPRTRRIGYLTPDGRVEGSQTLATLYRVASGLARPVVRCDRCSRPLTDEISRRRGYGPECAGKLAAEGRAS